MLKSYLLRETFPLLHIFKLFLVCLTTEQKVLCVLLLDQFYKIYLSNKNIFIFIKIKSLSLRYQAKLLIKHIHI